MPNVKKLVDLVGQIISERKVGEVFFSTIDLTHANEQFHLVQKRAYNVIFHG